jgi:hypothetical protein
VGPLAFADRRGAGTPRVAAAVFRAAPTVGPGPPFRFDDPRPGVNAHAVDPEATARPWALSADLTGTDAFASAG